MNKKDDEGIPKWLPISAYARKNGGGGVRVRSIAVQRVMKTLAVSDGQGRKMLGINGSYSAKQLQIERAESRRMCSGEGACERKQNDGEQEDRICEKCSGLRRQWTGTSDRCIICQKKLLSRDEAGEACCRCTWEKRLQTELTRQRIARLDENMPENEDTPAGKRQNRDHNRRTSMEVIDELTRGLDSESPNATSRMVAERRQSVEQEAKEGNKRRRESAEGGSETNEGSGDDTQQGARKRRKCKRGKDTAGNWRKRGRQEG